MLRLTAPSSVTDLQTRLDTCLENTNVAFDPRWEYQGPIILNQTLRLNGCGATLWALTGPVLTIRATVHLCNLRIEITGDISSSDLATCAILVEPSGKFTFENIEVHGLVCGLASEESGWQYPHSLALGGIAPGLPHHWRISLYTPTDCIIASHIAGVKITPSELRPGVNNLELHIDALPHDFLLDGHLLLSTRKLRRQIRLTAHADESSKALHGHGQLIWTPPIAISSPNRTARLIRNQLPKILFENSSLSEKKADFDSSSDSTAILQPKFILGAIFSPDSNRQPQPSQEPSIPAILLESPLEPDQTLANNNIHQPIFSHSYAKNPKPIHGVPTQGLFNNHATHSPTATEALDQLPIAPSPSLQSSPLPEHATPIKRRRGASLPANNGEFKPSKS